ncbi:MAG: ribosome silencing factor [Oscillospiraceae bacterium]|nr:ribosome silencing factor [Oscillospiraceae bacterium]
MLLSAKEAAIIAAKALDDKKARNLMMLEVKGVTTLAEYMILSTGTSDTHLRALCDEVEKKMEEAGEQVWHREGYRGDTWIVMDFCGVIVHVFTEEQRKFYDLERLWGDAPVVDLDPILNPQA